MLEPLPQVTNVCDTRDNKLRGLPADTDELMMVDYVPPNVSELSDRCFVFKTGDNDAVIKRCAKVSAPTMRHMQRTHRIEVDVSV